MPKHVYFAEYAEAWTRFAAGALSAYMVPREYPSLQLDTSAASKRAAAAADDMLAEFIVRMQSDTFNV